MSIADFTPERRDITLKGQPLFSVRGLSLSDITQVLRLRMPDMIALFNFYQEHELNVLTGGRSEEFMVRLLNDLPDLMFTLIATAADEPANVDIVARLPLAVQLDAISAILDLTFEQSGGPKNFLATLQTLVGALLPAPDGSLLPKAA